MNIQNLIFGNLLIMAHGVMLTAQSYQVFDYILAFAPAVDVMYILSQVSTRLAGYLLLSYIVKMLHVYFDVRFHLFNLPFVRSIYINTLVFFITE